MGGRRFRLLGALSGALVGAMVGAGSWQDVVAQGPVGAETASDLLPRLRRDILACWVIPADATGRSLRATLRFGPEGALVGEPAILTPVGDGVDRVLAASVIRAIRRCTPLPWMKDHARSYERWREMVVVFTAE